MKKKDSAPHREAEGKSLRDHWEKAYIQKPEIELGWYESDYSSSKRIISGAGIPKSARILLVGAGNSRLADELEADGFENIIVSDMSQTALDQMRNRLGEKVKYVRDDLTRPVVLDEIPTVDLWFDRAVLHFFTLEEDRTAYLNLLNKLVKPGGWVILAEFAEDGAVRCSGLDVRRYAIDEMQRFLGNNYHLTESFRYIYSMPNGDARPYNYAIFQRD